LEGLPVVTLRQRGRSAEVRDTKADHLVATDHDEQDGIKTRRKVTQPCVSSLSQLPATLGALMLC
jgi:hypothetical protein